VQAIRDLGRAVRELTAEVEEHREEHQSRRYAVEAARRARVVAEEAHDLTTMVIVHQVESTAYDLLRGGGVESERAHEAVSE
jgi:hypothetical protein